MFQLYSIHEKEGGILVSRMQHNSDILNIHTSRLGPTDSLEFAKVPTKRFELQGVHLAVILNKYSITILDEIHSLKTNSQFAPENGPSQKETIDFVSINLQVRWLLVSGRVDSEIAVHSLKLRYPQKRQCSVDDFTFPVWWDMLVSSLERISYQNKTTKLLDLAYSLMISDFRRLTWLEYKVYTLHS